MQKGKFTPELIAPCGMNCGVCSIFLLYVERWKNENILATAVGRGIANMHFSKSSAVGWQLSKLSIVWNAQVFHEKN
jgi:NO-binding membrane sensor protein with MHYT domain